MVAEGRQTQIGCILREKLKEHRSNSSCIHISNFDCDRAGAFTGAASLKDVVDQAGGAPLQDFGKKRRRLDKTSNSAPR